jgi:urea transport system substrate-binding protein
MSRKHGRSASSLAISVVLCLAALVAIGLAVGGCGSGGGGSSAAPTSSSTGGAAGGDTIKIGFVGDLSGGQAADGTTLLAATKLFVQQTNDAGGLLGKKVELLVEDGATDPKTSNEKAKALLGKGADVVVGPILSAARNAVYPTVTQAGKIFLYGSLYEGGAYDPLMFIDGEVPQQMIQGFVPWLVKEDGPKVYMVGSDYVWPRGTNAWIKHYLKPLGGSVVGEEYVAFGTTDFSSILTRIAKAKPDVVFNTVVGADAVAFSKQFYNYGLNKTMHFASACHFESYIQAIGPQASEGIQVCFGYFQNIKSPANDAFLAGYRQFEPKLPASTLTASTYTLLKMWGEAVKKAGTVDAQQVRKAFEGISLTADQSPIGPVTMRAIDHHSIRHIYIAVVHNGQFQVVQDLGSIEPGTNQRTQGQPPKD